VDRGLSLILLVKIETARVTHRERLPVTVVDMGVKPAWKARNLYSASHGTGRNHQNLTVTLVFHTGANAWWLSERREVKDDQLSLGISKAIQASTEDVGGCWWWHYCCGEHEWRMANGTSPRSFASIRDGAGIGPFGRS
jgi:hypothetical protein